MAINCAALPENLLEAELFGYEKGAFTDAKGSKPGLFVEANGGTLFLDEVGDLPLSLQAKLLRALQERVVRPLGGRKDVAFDVRLLAATNRDLETAVEEKRFREDLYFRINVIEVHLPPLRARGSDVLALAKQFLAVFAQRAKKPIVGVVPQAAEKLLNYSWPGRGKPAFSYAPGPSASPRLASRSAAAAEADRRRFATSILNTDSADIST